MDFRSVDRIKINRALRDLLLEASNSELREAFSGTGEDLEALAARGRAAALSALSEATNPVEVQDLHRGLGALVQMLRRRERLTVATLAHRACVDPCELRKIETEPGFDPNPRTIFQLARFFNLPEKSFIILSGALRVSPEVREEAVRFAACSADISGLTRDQRKILNQFVKFLREHTD